MCPNNEEIKWITTVKNNGCKNIRLALRIAIEKKEELTQFPSCGLICVPGLSTKRFFDWMGVCGQKK